MALNKDKNLKLYFSISEVAQMFDVNESTLRFWEKKFTLIKPRRNAGGTRFYTPAGRKTSTQYAWATTW